MPTGKIKVASIMYDLIEIPKVGQVVIWTEVVSKQLHKTKIDSFVGNNGATMRANTKDGQIPIDKLEVLVVENYDKPTDMATRGASMGTMLWEENVIDESDWEMIMSLDLINKEVEFELNDDIATILNERN